MMNRHGSYARTTATVQKKQLKAKNPHNQIGLDKLLEVQEKASSNPNSNFILTVKRGIKSLQSCPTAITTRKEACQLKYVGPALAKIICPTQFTTPTNANASETSFSTTTNTANPSRTQATSTTSTATTKVEQGPTKKEKTYQAEKLAAESLDVSKCGHWKVILIVDGREHKSKHVVSKCKQSGIPCEERHLPIGDMTWIAQSKDKSTGKLVEVLCGTIIERKESSDLVSSLFGTRYLEQRLRLQHCGLPQLLFLVEGGLNTNVNCPQETLEMAIMETRCLGFHVMQTEHLQDTVRQLKGLHRRIVQRTFPDAFRSELPTYTNSPTEAIGNRRRRRRPSSLLEMVFDTSPKAPLGTKRFLTYTELKAKVEMDREAGTRTIGAVYMAMLKQVSSLSHKKCEAIARQYPTIRALMSAFATAESPGTLVRDIPLDRQKVGPKSANELFVACCTKRNGALPERNDDAPTTKRTSKPKATSSLSFCGVAKLPSPGSCVDLTEDTPQKPAAQTSIVASQRSLSPNEDDANRCFRFQQKSTFATKSTTTSNNYYSNQKKQGTNTLLNGRGIGGVAFGTTTPRTTASHFDFCSPLFSSPDSMDLPSRGPPKPAPLATSPFEVDLTEQFCDTRSASQESCASSPNQNDSSILVMDDDHSDEKVAVQNSSSLPGLGCVSNSSSSGTADNNSGGGDSDECSIGKDLRSRLAKRRKVETIVID